MSYSMLIILPAFMLSTLDNLQISTGVTFTVFAVPEKEHFQLIAQDDPDDERPLI